MNKLQKYPGVYLKELFRTGNFSAALIIMKPQAAYPLHKHLTSCEKYIILSGKMKLNLGGKEFLLGSLNRMKIPMDTPHNVENVGTKNLIFITTCCPAFSGTDTIDLK